MWGIHAIIIDLLELSLFSRILNRSIQQIYVISRGLKLMQSRELRWLRSYHSMLSCRFQSFLNISALISLWIVKIKVLLRFSNNRRIFPKSLLLNRFFKYWYCLYRVFTKDLTDVLLSEEIHQILRKCLWLASNAILCCIVALLLSYKRLCSRPLWALILYFWKYLSKFILHLLLDLSLSSFILRVVVEHVNSLWSFETFSYSHVFLLPIHYCLIWSPSFFLLLHQTGC